MRKINMKRKTKKDQAKSDEENGVEEKPKDSSEEESGERSSESDSEPEPEAKKPKADKRKSVSPNKKTPKKDTAKEPEEDAEYEVEQVLDEKLVRGVRHYLIRWKGYEPESDSWEPESTLECSDLIKKFKASHTEKNGENRNVKGKKQLKKIKGTKDKKEKKDKKKDEDNAEWDSNDEFEVDRIIDVYFKRNGKREFLVSWKGYPTSQDSWEPEENLGCSDLIAKFMSKVNAAKNVDQKELRINRHATDRFTLSTRDSGRRLSRRIGKKQRVHYYDAE